MESFDILLSVCYVGSFFITNELRILILKLKLLKFLILNSELLSSNDRNVALTMMIPEAKNTKETKHPYAPALHTPLQLIYTPTCLVLM